MVDNKLDDMHEIVTTDKATIRMEELEALEKISKRANDTINEAINIMFGDTEKAILRLNLNINQFHEICNRENCSKRQINEMKTGSIKQCEAFCRLRNIIRDHLKE